MHKNAYFNKATDKFIFVLATLYMENFRKYFSNPFTVKKTMIKFYITCNSVIIHEQVLAFVKKTNAIKLKT